MKFTSLEEYCEEKKYCYTFVCDNKECGNYREGRYSNNCKAFNNRHKVVGKCDGFISKDKDELLKGIEHTSKMGGDCNIKKRDELLEEYERRYMK